MPKGQHFKQYKITYQFIYAYDIIRLLTGYKFTLNLMIEYSYLTPPNHYKHIKFQKNYIYEKINGKHIRRIFNHNHYESFQRDQIHKLKDYLQKKAPNITYPDQLLLRFCYLGDFMIHEAYNQVQLYDQWHQNQLITTITKQARQILEYGHIYTYGRDEQYCPVIIIRPNKIDLKKYQIDDYQNAIYAILNPIEQYMLVGGFIEKWNLLVDFQDKKCHLNKQLLNKCFKRLLYAYPFRLKRLLFANTKGINQLYITETTNFIEDPNKLVEVQVVSNDRLSHYIREEEREKKYGGSLANLCEYWPIHTTSKHQQKQDESLSNTEYKSVLNDAQFFGEADQPMCGCISSKCTIY